MKNVVFKGSFIGLEQFIGDEVGINEGEAIKALYRAYVPVSEERMEWVVDDIGISYLIYVRLIGAIDGTEIIFNEILVKEMRKNMQKTTTKRAKYVSILVYGTLLKGEGNHHMLAGAELVGDAKLKGILYDMPYGFPAVIEGDGVVLGEVYNVPISKLRDLDRLEGYRESNKASSMYLREFAEVELMDGELMQVYFYKWNRELPNRSIKWEDNIKWGRVLRSSLRD